MPEQSQDPQLNALRYYKWSEGQRQYEKRVMLRFWTVGLAIGVALVTAALLLPWGAGL